MVTLGRLSKIMPNTPMGAHLPHADAAGLLLQARDLANHIGHGFLPAARTLGAGFQNLRRQAQAVHHRADSPLATASLQVARIGVLQGACCCQCCGQMPQRSVFVAADALAMRAEATFACKPKEWV